MKKAGDKLLQGVDKKQKTRFYLPITEEIYTDFQQAVANQQMEQALSLLWEIKPSSVINTGEHLGVNSLNLLLSVKNVSEEIIKLYEAIVNYINNYTEANINYIIYEEAKTYNKQSPLWLSAWGGRWQLVYQLIQAGADINATCIEEGLNKGKSIIWFAAFYNKWETVTKLIQAGADINATCVGEGVVKGISVLWLSAFHKQWEVVAKLITNGADINATCVGEGTDKGISILWLAANAKQWKLVAQLITNGADINATCVGEGPNKGQSILWLAAFNKQWELVAQLITNGADINATWVGEVWGKGISVLWLAAVNNKWELVTQLIQAGADINATCVGEGADKGKSILWLAANDKQWELVAQLITNGVDINVTCAGEGLAKENTFLWLVSKDKQLESGCKDLYYAILFIFLLQGENLNILYTDLNQELIAFQNKVKYEINWFMQVFIPDSRLLEEYKQNQLNNLPKEIKINILYIALEQRIKNELDTYIVEEKFIKFIISKMHHYFFSNKDEELQKKCADIQKKFEEGPHHYEKILFINILSALNHVNNQTYSSPFGNILGTLTYYKTKITDYLINNDKVKINKSTFDNSFMPAFRTKNVGSLNKEAREKIYEKAKDYAKENEIGAHPTESDFINILALPESP